MALTSFAVAFLGGTLSLLAPCSALLLPSFFAYAFTTRTQLFGRTLLFLAGLGTIFVPLGLGVSLVTALLIDARQTTILVAGLLMIGFGLLELFGGGFSFLPSGLAGRFQGGRSTAAVYATGLLYGLSGFCAGPLLGAVLTVAAVSASPILAAGLLLTYALGTAAPLFLLAWLWDRYQLGQQRWLRGRALRLGPLTVHSTNLVASLLFITLGLSFIVFEGSSGLSAVYADLGLDERGFRAQLWVVETIDQLPPAVWGIALIVALVGLTIVYWARRRRPGLPGRCTHHPLKGA
jgi:cytochrome c biogenesis protein CcdA